MGRINDAYDSLCQELTDAGLTVVNDSRNARPGTVLVEPATLNVVSVSGAQIMLEFPVVAIAVPPGNLDSLRQLYDTADVIIDATTAVSAQPGVYQVGSQELPCITVTVNYPAQN